MSSFLSFLLSQVDDVLFWVSSPCQFAFFFELDPSTWILPLSVKETSPSRRFLFELSRGAREPPPCVKHQPLPRCSGRGSSLERKKETEKREERREKKRGITTVVLVVSVERDEVLATRRRGGKTQKKKEKSKRFSLSWSVTLVTGVASKN